MSNTITYKWITSKDSNITQHYFTRNYSIPSSPKVFLFNQEMDNIKLKEYVFIMNKTYNVKTLANFFRAAQNLFIFRYEHSLTKIVTDIDNYIKYSSMLHGNKENVFYLDNKRILPCYLTFKEIYQYKHKSVSVDIFDLGKMSIQAFENYYKAIYEISEIIKLGS